MQTCMRWLVVIIVTLALLGSCSGPHGSAGQLQRPSEAAGAGSMPDAGPANPGPLGIALPPPAELAPLLQSPDGALRSVSYRPEDLSRDAEEPAALLPSQNVSADSDGLTFSPDFSGKGAQFGGLAFAMYGFRINDYGGDSSMHFAWHSAVPSAGTAWLALADTVSNRWVFRELNATSLALPPLGPFFDEDDSLLAAVILTGSEAFELDSLRVGSLPPKVTLSASPEAGLSPLSVDFAVSGVDLDGEIVEYLWDPEGSGLFSISSGSDPSFSHVYETDGEFLASMRAVDNDGVYRQQDILIRAGKRIPLICGTAEDYEMAASTILLPDGDLFLAGMQFYNLNNSSRIVVCRCSPSGSIRYVKYWGESQVERIGMAVAGFDGAIYLCGETAENGSRDGLLQKWTPEGELVWSRTFGLQDASESLHSMFLTGDAIYACGSEQVEAISKRLGLILRTDLDGNVVWTTSIIAPGNCQLRDLLYNDTSILNGDFISAGGSYEPSAGDKDVLIAHFSLQSGELDEALLWGSTGLDEEVNCVSLGSGAIFRPVFFAGSGLSGSDTFLGISGGSVLTFSANGASQIFGTDLRGRTLLANALVQNQASTEFEFRPLLVSFDNQLGNLLGSMAGSGDFLAAGLDSFDAQSLILSGEEKISLPEFAPADLAANPSLLEWRPVSPSTGNPQITAQSTFLTTIEPDNWFENPGGEQDNMAVLFGSFAD